MVILIPESQDSQNISRSKSCPAVMVGPKLFKIPEIRRTQSVEPAEDKVWLNSFQYVVAFSISLQLYV